ncbi:FixH family protein [Streptomyces sp. RB110-1]|uniref:FixH family protein n=1 Tax=unclassified Streptomyces TaxID=2593676 RepID=UPI00190279C6|nr:MULTISPECIES: FixH family protein [unclassified Streptomyces]MBK0372947.1 FixH family protein [Streptomyces sp. RB110-1]MBK0390685.1 FixH family protein [Streptomyces sp. RB110-2]
MTWRTATAQPAVRGTDTVRRPGPRTFRGLVRLAAVTSTALAAVLVTGCSTTSPATADTTNTGGKALDAKCSGTETADGLEVSLIVSPCPAKGGGAASTAAITVEDTAGKAVEGAKVQINPEMPNMKMKGSNQSASVKGDGYEAKLVLGMPGDWLITVVVTPTSGKTSSAAFDLKAK